MTTRFLIFWWPCIIGAGFTAAALRAERYGIAAIYASITLALVVCDRLAKRKYARA